MIFKKSNHESKLQGQYKCKINHHRVQVVLNDQMFFVKEKNRTQGIDYKQIQKVALQVKWWRIRVKLKCKQGVYAFDFPNYNKACTLYEELVYKKVANRL